MEPSARLGPRKAGDGNRCGESDCALSFGREQSKCANSGSWVDLVEMLRIHASGFNRATHANIEAGPCTMPKTGTLFKFFQLDSNCDFITFRLIAFFFALSSDSQVIQLGFSSLPSWRSE
jgi:hypothetical protein